MLDSGVGHEAITSIINLERESGLVRCQAMAGEDREKAVSGSQTEMVEMSVGQLIMATD